MTLQLNAERERLFDVKYKEGSLDPKARARKTGASDDEVWETVAYAMRPVAAKVRNFAKDILATQD